MRNTFVFPYNKDSQGAKQLAGGLGALRVKKERSRFRGGKDKVVVNWGNTQVSPEIDKSHIINDPVKVGVVTNKLSFFKAMKDGAIVTTPDWTTSKNIGKEWLIEGKCSIFARTKLTGHSGEGIVEVKKPADLDNIRDGTLLVRYVPKKEEYRLHYSKLDGCFFIQRKARRLINNNPNWRIRNHQNGFVYARDCFKDTPNCVEQQAKLAFDLSGLDFGAVDVLYNLKHNRAYVLEINSAPGIEGTTVDAYVNTLHRMCSLVQGEEAPAFLDLGKCRPEKVKPVFGHPGADPVLDGVRAVAARHGGNAADWADVIVDDPARDFEDHDDDNDWDPNEE